MQFSADGALLMTASRRPQNKGATREDILAAATALFVERGDAQITMDALCEQGGFSKKTLYEYFASKEAIGVAVSRQVTQLALAPAEQALADGEAPGVVLYKLCAAQVRQVEATPKLAQVVYTYGLRDVCQPGEEAPPLLSVLDQVFRRGQEAKLFREPPSSAELALMTYGLLATTVLHWVGNPDGPSLMRRVELALVASLHGWFQHVQTEAEPGAPAKPKKAWPDGPILSRPDFWKLLDS